MMTNNRTAADEQDDHEKSVPGDDNDKRIPTPITPTQNSKRISFPADSILNAVIQDGDVCELLRILRYQRTEVDLNQTNHTGLTALHHAVLTNNLDSVKLLLNYGADVKRQDMYGFSPLHTAAALGFLQITTILILYGADVFSQTKQSELPIDVAKDVTVVRVLYKEMHWKLHAELYFRSVVKMNLWRLLACIFKVICYVYQTCRVIVSMVKVRYNLYRTTQEVKNGSVRVNAEHAPPDVRKQHKDIHKPGQLRLTQDVNTDISIKKDV